MIVFFTTRAHNYTVKAFRKWLGAEIKIVCYDALFRCKALPQATYVFTDMDRLGFWELEFAADAYRALQSAGLRVLNDPARVRQRLSLLKALKVAGINRFNAWRVEDDEWPDRYPVFLRLQSAHRNVLSALLSTAGELEQAIEGEITKGRPRKELMIVEYCAEPVRDQFFRKLSAFRVGEQIIQNVSIHDSSWAIKHGKTGVAGQPDYEWEHQAISENRYEQVIRRAFEIADIEYGRADFGLVADTPQFYEINTNPQIRPASKPHSFETRTQSQILTRDNLIKALKSINTPFRGTSKVANGKLILDQRRLDRLIARARWTP